MTNHPLATSTLRLTSQADADAVALLCEVTTPGIDPFYAVIDTTQAIRLTADVIAAHDPHVATHPLAARTLATHIVLQILGSTDVQTVELAPPSTHVDAT